MVLKLSWLYLIQILRKGNERTVRALSQLRVMEQNPHPPKCHNDAKRAVWNMEGSPKKTYRLILTTVFRLPRNHSKTKIAATSFGWQIINININ